MYCSFWEQLLKVQFEIFFQYIITLYSNIILIALDLVLLVLVDLNHDAKLLYIKWSQIIKSLWRYSLLLKNQGIWLTKRELGTKTKSQTIKLFEMTESTCCIYVCLPKCKDQVTNMVSWFACNTRVIVYEFKSTAFPCQIVVTLSPITWSSKQKLTFYHQSIK